MFDANKNFWYGWSVWSSLLHLGVRQGSVVCSNLSYYSKNVSANYLTLMFVNTLQRVVAFFFIISKTTLSLNKHTHTHIHTHAHMHIHTSTVDFLHLIDDNGLFYTAHIQISTAHFTILITECLYSFVILLQLFQPTTSFTNSYIHTETWQKFRIPIMLWLGFEPVTREFGNYSDLDHYAICYRCISYSPIKMIGTLMPWFCTARLYWAGVNLG